MWRDGASTAGSAAEEAPQGLRRVRHIERTSSHDMHQPGLQSRDMTAGAPDEYERRRKDCPGTATPQQACEQLGTTVDEYPGRGMSARRICRTPEECFQAGWDDAVGDPPLTDRQRTKLAALLAPFVRPIHEAA